MTAAARRWQALRSLVLFAAALAAGCSVLACHLWFRPGLPPRVTLPIGSPAPRDASRAFAGVFCSLLEGEASSWGSCAHYLAPAAGPRPLPPVPADLRMVVIPGLMAPCFTPEVRTFGEGLERLQAMGVCTATLPVSGLGSTAYNARQIVAWLRERITAEPQARFLLVGFSKGAVDALEALALDPSLGEHVVALVTVAGAIGGSRIPERIPPSLQRLGLRMAPSRCEEGDGGALESLHRRPRLEFLRRHPEPLVPTYSIVAVSRPETTSRLFLRARGALDRIDEDNDGQLLAADAVVPGALYLGAALGDHFAVAMPFQDAGLPWSQLVDRNRYPRGVLLEAIIRFVGEDLSHGRILHDAPAVGSGVQDDES